MAEQLRKLPATVEAALEMDLKKSASVETMPEELLQEVFSYCSYEDLVRSVQNVSTRWREVSRAARLWQDLVYHPNTCESDGQIVEMLKISPKLQAVSLKCKHSEEVVQALAQNCPELRKLVLSSRQNVSYDVLKNLQEKCPKIQHLTVPSIFLTALDKCDIIGRFTNLMTLCIQRRNYSYSNLRPIAKGCPKLGHLDLAGVTYKIDDLRYLLQTKYECLHTLHVSCSSDICGGCTLPLLSVCTSLKSLSVDTYCADDRIVATLGGLKTVTSLSWQGILVEDMISHLLKVFDNGNMAQLIELKICDIFSCNDSLTKVVIENCPLLQSFHLIRCEDCTDESLRMLHTLKDMKSLTILWNGNITDDGVLHLMQIGQLKYLSLGACDRLTEKSFEFITNFRELLVLKFYDQNFRGFPVDLVVNRMRRLSWLDISQCLHVDVVALEGLKSHVPHLRVSIDSASQSGT